MDRAQVFAPLLTEAMALYEIGTPERQAIFLAQVGHESGHLRYTTELWGLTLASRLSAPRFRFALPPPRPPRPASAAAPSRPSPSFALSLPSLRVPSGTPMAQKTWKAWTGWLSFRHWIDRTDTTWSRFGLPGDPRGYLQVRSVSVH